MNSPFAVVNRPTIKNLYCGTSLFGKPISRKVLARKDQINQLNGYYNYNYNNNHHNAKGDVPHLGGNLVSEYPNKQHICEEYQQE